ncbi:TniB family NTP-binding protein [Vibrio sp. CAU 1672]|uniref:TniB family NTP-binding protein n=1 Tax=Vibrio sp. CAU 1672 TaxID=3032594 RepID=UPI0023DC9E46|nr:TniB family NTP-binding protein [Vibrio sp. CAU 1672]MDF2152884.1 TniB family NTP-binding protein [Vibrio sp. CAU 1672]
MTSPNLHTDQILEAYHQSFTVYPNVEKVFAGLDWLIKRRKFGPFVPSMLLTGGTGAGKSALLLNYISNSLSANEVLTIRVRPTLHETLLWILRELKVYKNNRAKPSDIGLTDHLITCIKRAKLKLLVIEECQELFECTNHNQRQDIRDRLKMLSDICRLPIVFVGLPSAKLILEDSQWHRRIMIKRELPYVKITDENSIDQYLGLLEAMEDSVPIDLETSLTDFDLAMRLLAASSGMLGMLKELIALALESALIQGKSVIHLEDFALSYEQIFGSDETNPFSEDINQLVIKQIESYEEYVPDSTTGELKFVGQIFSELTIKQLLG